MEPVSTVDLDIFIALEPQPGQFLISLQPVYDYLKSKNAVPEGECILISGWPVQVLVPNSPLVEEALQEAVESDVEGVKLHGCSDQNILQQLRFKQEEAKIKADCLSLSSKMHLIQSGF